MSAERETHHRLAPSGLLQVDDDAALATIDGFLYRRDLQLSRDNSEEWQSESYLRRSRAAPGVSRSAPDSAPEGCHHKEGWNITPLDGLRSRRAESRYPASHGRRSASHRQR